MDIYQPFTYLIKFKPTGQVYYGSRTAKGCNIEQLWTTYFTSSKVIKQLISEFGKDAFEFQIRKIFKTRDAALKWESSVLHKFNAAKNPSWFNKTNGNKQFVGGYYGPLVGLKISLALKGKKRGPMPEETKKKLSAAKKGKEGHPHTPESKAKIAEANKKRKGIKKPPMSDEQKQQISISNTGKKRTVAFKIKLSELVKNRKHTDATKQKIGAAQKGKIVSLETKQKISNTKKGSKHTDETKKKISALNTGKKRSDEVKKAQSDRMKGKKPPSK